MVYADKEAALKDIMNRALNLAHLRGAQYADIRIVHNRTQTISVRDGIVESVDDAETEGFGVRILVNDAWGFASSRDLSPSEVDRVTAQALEIARASALVSGGKVDLGPAVTSQGVYATPFQVDPFGVSLEDKLALLTKADAEMGSVSGIRTRRSNLSLVREHKFFANTEGAFTEQTILETGGGIQATAVGNGEIQIRSYPNSFGRQQVTGGWEELLKWDLPGNGVRVASEAVALLTADPCPSNLTTTLILGGSQLGLQIHESCGHPTELDRVFGAEAAYAGTSFLTTDKLGTFQYGSPVVNLTADSIRPLGLGTFGWDDEGVPAQSSPLVKDGLFVGYLMSRETASRLGRTSNACMRASGWNRLPIIRMVNVSLEPGTWTFDDLIADTEDGIYMELNRSWSIDDKRYNFQFGTEIGYEIKGGKMGRMLRNCTYTGITPEFWNSCDAICNAEYWTMWGTPNCGKGQPGQVAHTGHGAAPARFRNIKVGVLK
jgi:TldD protein